MFSEQQAGNQKSAEDKEEVNTNPSSLTKHHSEIMNQGLDV